MIKKTAGARLRRLSVILNSGQKPANLTYPKKLKTIGDHLRACRLDRGLSQSEVATILQVTIDTVTNWELKRNEPQIRQIPSVLEFLGYDPFNLDMSDLSDRVRWCRLSLGLSYKQLAKKVGVDEVTIKRIEMGQKTYKNSRSKVCQYFKV